MHAPRLLVAALLLLALAGCAPGAHAPWPVAATLSDAALELEMSGGQRCRLPRAQAARDTPAGWGGPVQGCTGVAQVEVELATPGPLRRLFGALAPAGEVRVTGPDGRVTRFDSPAPQPLRP